MLMNIALLERVISYLVVIRICVLIRHLKQKPWPLLFEQSENFLQKTKKEKKKKRDRIAGIFFSRKHAFIQKTFHSNSMLDHNLVIGI